MVNQPRSIFLAASLGAVISFAQTSVTPSSILEGTRVPPQAAPEEPKPVLSPESRGDIMMARKMYREAIETFQTEPHKNAVLYNKIGIAYHQLQQLDNAKKSYEQALKLKRDYAEAVNNIGTIYYAKKSYRRAIGYYQRALRLQKSASIYSNLGTAYFARKVYKRAK